MMQPLAPFVVSPSPLPFPWRSLPPRILPQSFTTAPPFGLGADQPEA